MDEMPENMKYLKNFIDKTQTERIAKLEKVIRFAAGLISTMDQFSDKHPQEVEEWLYTNALNRIQSNAEIISRIEQAEEKYDSLHHVKLKGESDDLD